MSQPIICLGQQPCGFFPKRFFVSKIWTARRLQRTLGGEIALFYHDSDHDPRETMTKLRDRKSGVVESLNFAFINKIQKKYTPLYAKRVDSDWQANTARQLPKYVSNDLAELFAANRAETVADFCLEMYRGMGLLEGVRVERSSDPAFRERAVAVDDFFIDVEYEGELARARRRGDGFAIHCGGNTFIDVPVDSYRKTQVSPTRDSRLVWMQSAIGCTHYVAGASEIKYMDTSATPEIEFVERDAIDRIDEAYVGE